MVIECGVVSISDLSWPNIETNVERAYTMSQYTDNDKCVGLVAKDQLAFGYPDLEKYHPWNVEPEQLMDMAIHCERAGLDYSEKIVRSDSVSASSSNSLSFYANSKQFSGHYLSTYHSITCQLIAESNGDMQSHYEYSAESDYKKLLEPGLIAERAAERCIRQLGAKSISSKKCKVLFEAPIAASLIKHFFSAILVVVIFNQKSSWLVDGIGKQILPEGYNICQSPHIKGYLAGLPFDGDGVMTRNIDFVKKGYLQSYALGAYSARKLAMESTGNACGILNLSLRADAKKDEMSFNQLLQRLDTGLLVTSLIGQGVNITTGEYSRGATGFLGRAWQNTICRRGSYIGRSFARYVIKY